MSAWSTIIVGVGGIGPLTMDAQLMASNSQLGRNKWHLFPFLNITRLYIVWVKKSIVNDTWMAPKITVQEEKWSSGA